MTTIPNDIVALDSAIEGTIWPQLQANQTAHFQSNGSYFGAEDLAVVAGYEYLEPGVYSVVAYDTEEGVKGYVLITRKTSATPTIITEPYVANWNPELPASQQLVEYRDIEYFDWERIDDITPDYRSKYWTYGNLES